MLTDTHDTALQHYRSHPDYAKIQSETTAKPKRRKKKASVLKEIGRLGESAFTPLLREPTPFFDAWRSHPDAERYEPIYAVSHQTYLLPADKVCEDCRPKLEEVHVPFLVPTVIRR